MHRGSHFGEFELIRKTKREFGTMTYGHCKLLAMDNILFARMNK